MGCLGGKFFQFAKVLNSSLGHSQPLLNLSITAWCRGSHCNSPNHTTKHSSGTHRRDEHNWSHLGILTREVA